MEHFLLGLTGGLASGKSTVAGWLREAGFLVVDADRLVAELHAAGGRGAAAVRELFGEEVLTTTGAVDHAALARQIFTDPEARHRLEAAIHPLVRQRFQEIAATTSGVIALEATLLVEAGYGPDFDLVVSVEADLEKRLARAVARGMDEAAARARLAAQGNGEKRRSEAHRLLYNDGTLADLRREVDLLIAELRQRVG